ncbi:MAG: molybdenum cofactor guanylyltransferase [Elusimicrobiota bacterium]
MIAGVTGLLLAGGRSRRFGSNKALADWRGGKLVESPARILTGLFPLTLLPAKDPAAYGFLEGPRLRALADGTGESHPLAGLAAGLRACPTERVFACACDMPFLQPALVEALCAAASGFDAVLPLWGGALQPLCAVYAKSILPAAQELLRDGRPLRDLTGLARTRIFSEEEIRRTDPIGLSFRDLDTREDHAAALGEAIPSPA